MLVTHAPAIYFPAINQWPRLYEEFGFTPERYKHIGNMFFNDFPGNLKTSPLRTQLVALQTCCKDTHEYYLMLLLCGLNTQYWTEDNKRAEIKFLGIKFASVSIGKKIITMPKADNWDDLITEFKFRPENLEAIYKEYHKREVKTDFRKQSLKKQMDLLSSCCRRHPWDYSIVLLNIGMDTMNWITVNEKIPQ
jgi:hypothetical protein